MFEFIYPAPALAEGVQGRVPTMLTIQEDGAVVDVQPATYTVNYRRRW